MRPLQLFSQTCSLTQPLEVHQVIFMPVGVQAMQNLLERLRLEHFDQIKLEEKYLNIPKPENMTLLYGIVIREL